MCGPVAIRMCVYLCIVVYVIPVWAHKVVSQIVSELLDVCCCFARSGDQWCQNWDDQLLRESEDEEMWYVGISCDHLKIPTWCNGKPTDVFNILRLMQPAGLETQAPWQAEGTWVKCVFRLKGGDCLPAGCVVFCCGVLSCSQQRPGQLHLNNKRPQKKNHVNVRPS